MKWYYYILFLLYYALYYSVIWKENGDVFHNYDWRILLLLLIPLFVQLLSSSLLLVLIHIVVFLWQKQWNNVLIIIWTLKTNFTVVTYFPQYWFCDYYRCCCIMHILEISRYRLLFFFHWPQDYCIVLIVGHVICCAVSWCCFFKVYCIKLLNGGSVCLYRIRTQCFYLLCICCCLVLVLAHKLLLLLLLSGKTVLLWKYNIHIFIQKAFCLQMWLYDAHSIYAICAICDVLAMNTSEHMWYHIYISIYLSIYLYK